MMILEQEMSFDFLPKPLGILEFALLQRHFDRLTVARIIQNLRSVQPMLDVIAFHDHS
jgi:hypothetical protein